MATKIAGIGIVVTFLMQAVMAQIEPRTVPAASVHPIVWELAP